MARKQIKREPLVPEVVYDLNSADTSASLNHAHPSSSGDTEIYMDRLMTRVNQAIPNSDKPQTTCKLKELSKNLCANTLQQVMHIVATARVRVVPLLLTLVMILRLVFLLKDWNC